MVDFEPAAPPVVPLPAARPPEPVAPDAPVLEPAAPAEPVSKAPEVSDPPQAKSPSGTAATMTHRNERSRVPICAPVLKRKDAAQVGYWPTLPSLPPARS